MSHKVTKPLPYKQLAVICVCRFAEPICFTVIFPFIVQMVREFHISEEKNVGYYVGFITSCFALTQLLTGIQWGMLSDRIGRRPVILQGLVGTVTSILLFGLSKSFVWALLSRSLCGLLNGNVSVLKSMVSELTMDCLPHQRATAFSALPLVYGLGSIVGPILGGFLSHPVENYPIVFGDLGFVTELLSNYPYFLPCFISAFICTLGLVFGYFFLEETHPANKYPQQPQKQQQYEEVQDEEETLLKPSHTNETGHYSTFEEDVRTGAVKIQHSPTPTIHDRHSSPTLKDALTPAVLAICIAYGCFALQAVFMDELFPLYTASSRENGGLNFSPHEIGSALAFSGVVTLISQLIVLPTLSRKFGLLKLLHIVLTVCVFLYIFQGVIRLLYSVPDLHGHIDTKFWVWAGLLCMVAIKTICHTISFTSYTILINNACPSVDSLGSVNGFSQCCASLSRMLGPSLCGISWSASLAATWLPYQARINTTFLLLSMFGSVTLYLSKRLDPADYETAHAREEVVHVYENDHDHEADTSSSSRI